MKRNIGFRMVLSALVTFGIFAGSGTVLGYGGGSGFIGGIGGFAFTPTPSPTVSTAPAPQTAQCYVETANPGDGVSHLAARALARYLADNPDVQLSPGGSFYVIDRLWRAALEAIGDPSFVLHPGGTISFCAIDIEHFAVHFVGGGSGGDSDGSSNVTLDASESPGVTPTESPVVTASPSGQEGLEAAIGNQGGWPWWIPWLILLLLILWWLWRRRRSGN